MPNRWVREDAIESEPVNSVSWQGEVFWRRLLNRVDDFGRYSANLKLLRTQIFPLQIDKVAEMDVARLLSECEKAGLLFVYEAFGKPYLVLNKWEKGRAKKSKHPDPPPDICMQMQTFVYKCEQTQTNAPTSDPEYRLPNTDTESERAHARETVAIPRSVEEVKAYGLMQAILPEVCSKFWDDMEADGWMNKHGRIWPDWMARLRSYATTWRANENKTNSNGHAVNGKPRSVYELSKIIESKERIVKELERRYSTESPTGTDWSDQQKKEMWKADKKLIRELNDELSRHGNPRA